MQLIGATIKSNEQKKSLWMFINDNVTKLLRGAGIWESGKFRNAFETFVGQWGGQNGISHPKPGNMLKTWPAI